MGGSSSEWLIKEDQARVRPYELAIRRAVHGGACTSFLEVGTGAKLGLALKVIEAATSTKVVAIEASAKAFEEAGKLIKRKAQTKKYQGLEERITLISGLSTDAEVTATTVEAVKTKLQGCQAVVQELLGFWAGSEGAAYIMHHALSQIVQSPSVVVIPARAATFLCPVLLDDADLPCRRRATFHAPGAFALMSDLDIARAARATGGQGPDWLKGGVMEFLTFTEPDRLCQVQQHHCSLTSSRDARVNSLATWLWAEMDDDGATDTTPRTGYPWGATDEEAPAAGPGSVALSTRKDDGAAYASSWQNAIIPFHDTILVPANIPLHVAVRVDPRES